MAAAEATGDAASPRIGPAVLDALVVGAGQAGLEAGGAPGGSWPGYYDSLTLFSPARRHVARNVMDPTSATPDNVVRAKFAQRACHAHGAIEEL
jgi:hypothetical protein